MNSVRFNGTATLNPGNKNFITQKAPDRLPDFDEYQAAIDAAAAELGKSDPVMRATILVSPDGPEHDTFIVRQGRLPAANYDEEAPGYIVRGDRSAKDLVLDAARLAAEVYPAKATTETGSPPVTARRFWREAVATAAILVGGSNAV